MATTTPTALFRLRYECLITTLLLFLFQRRTLSRRTPLFTPFDLQVALATCGLRPFAAAQVKDLLDGLAREVPTTPAVARLLPGAVVTCGDEDMKKVVWMVMYMQSSTKGMEPWWVKSNLGLWIKEVLFDFKIKQRYICILYLDKDYKGIIWLIINIALFFSNMNSSRHLQLPVNTLSGIGWML